MSCPLYIALALAEVQMCPALPQGKRSQVPDIFLECTAEVGRGKEAQGSHNQQEG